MGFIASLSRSISALLAADSLVVEPSNLSKTMSFRSTEWISLLRTGGAGSAGDWAGVGIGVDVGFGGEVDLAVGARTDVGASVADTSVSPDGAAVAGAGGRSSLISPSDWHATIATDEIISTPRTPVSRRAEIAMLCLMQSRWNAVWAELNYRPAVAARSLTTRSTNSGQAWRSAPIAE